MRIRKYICFTAIAICIAAVLLRGSDSPDPTLADSGAEPMRRTNLLCAGLDNAAGNTDVLMLISFDEESREITVLQIPRDTYFFADTAQKKINQLYPGARLAGKNAQDALAFVGESISAAMGIPIDGYLAVNLSTVADLIDGIGGVTLRVPTAIRHRASDGDGYVEIAAGENHLTGREAIEFLRFRSGYTEGDLGRMDAQKLLLAATYRKLREEMSLPLIAKLLTSLHGRIYTDIPLSEQLSLARAYYAGREDFRVRFLTLPGEAARGEETSGLSYYVVNRKSAFEVMQRYFCGGDFDPSVRFCDRSRAHFMNIYYDEKQSYTVYTEETLGALDVKTKQK